MTRVFVIEDDDSILDSIIKGLQKWDYTVGGPTVFTDIMPSLVTFKPDLVLIDIKLPFYDGYYWCQEIRKKSTVPIIFLSSQSEAKDIVMAVNLGADDYITKPFKMAVLIAKIQAVMRRSYDLAPEQTKELVYGSVILNLLDMTLSYQQKELVLTKNDFCILKTLYLDPGHLVSRESLMEALWDSDYFIDDNTLTVNVGRLRKKLSSIGLGDLIKTKKGIGYGLGSL